MNDFESNQAENPLGQIEQKKGVETPAETESRFENKQEAIRVAMEKFNGVVDERGKMGKLDADFADRVSTEKVPTLFRAPNNPEVPSGDLVLQKTVEAAQMAAEVMYPKLRQLQENAKTAGETYFSREREEIEAFLRQASESEDPLKAIESANGAIGLFEKVADDMKRERDESYRLKHGLIDDATQNASRAMYLDMRTKDVLGGHYDLDGSVAEQYAADSKTFASDIEKDVAGDFGADHKFLEDLRSATDEFRIIAQEVGKR